MRHTIAIEWIGAESERRNASLYRLCEAASGQRERRQSRRPWVAEIAGLCPTYRFVRTFIDGQIDYQDSSGSGNRRVYLRWHLKPETFYEVSCRTSWRSVDRYFLHVWRESCHRVDAATVETWFRENDRLASTC